MANEATPEVGDLVDGRYELIRVIGAGGMGQVWEARDHQLEAPCAVKFILEHMARDKQVRGRFAREAKAVAALRTAHTVQVFGLGEHKGSPYIAMELLEGETLRGRLSRLGCLDVNTTLAIVEQVGHALERARIAQIVHRDLKPENIWLSAERDVFVKVLDFGVAKAQLTTSSLQTVTGALLGTPYYMSPEQAMGKATLDYRSDLWALAIIAVECLSGRRPFESESLSELLINIVTTTPPPITVLGAHLPPGLQAFWERGLAREPDARFQSAAELLEALRRALLEPMRDVPVAPPPVAAQSSGTAVGTAVSVSPVSSTRPGRKSGFPWHGVAAALGGVVAVTLAITIARAFLGDESPPAKPATSSAAAPAAASAQSAPASGSEPPSKPPAPAEGAPPTPRAATAEPDAEEDDTKAVAAPRPQPAVSVVTADPVEPSRPPPAASLAPATRERSSSLATDLANLTGTRAPANQPGRPPPATAQPPRAPVVTPAPAAAPPVRKKPADDDSIGF